ncbi:hypothetical protein LguiB_004296 [Lonicera macranthoides]
MDHPVHPSHTLTMLLTREVQECWKLKWIGDFLGEPMSCDVCGDWISNKCIYGCSRCNFRMDIVCASLNERNIQHPSHQHPLFPLGQPISCKCNACGEEHAGKGIFYYCRACPIFFIHKDCASLSASINRSSHEHPLKLAYSLPSQFPYFGNRCDHWWGYLPWMSGHSSVDDLIQLPLSDESVTLISYFLKDKSIQRKNDRATPSKLHHFSPFRHDQPLIPFHGEINEIESGSGASRGKVSCSLCRRVDDETLCEACVKPVLATTPFYRCEESTTQCNFFLDKCCAELPMEIKRSLISELPLILLPKCPEFFGLFICSGCDYFCNGFIYNCGNSRYCLDVTCAFLPRIVKHVAHPYHVLFLIKISFFVDNNSKRCNACSQLVDRTVFVYSCDTRGFRLDIHCALLPQTIRYRYDEHPFTLTFSHVKNHFDDYYCEICKKILDPKQRLYNCGCCDQAIHIECLRPFDRRSSIKFGGTLTVEKYPHPLTLIPAILDKWISQKINATLIE